MWRLCSREGTEQGNRNKKTAARNRCVQRDWSDRRLVWTLAHVTLEEVGGVFLLGVRISVIDIQIR